MGEPMCRHLAKKAVSAYGPAIAIPNTTSCAIRSGS
ncbi:hypothetical protein [Bordetella tumulicola]